MKQIGFMSGFQHEFNSSSVSRKRERERERERERKQISVIDSWEIGAGFPTVKRDKRPSSKRRRPASILYISSFSFFLSSFFFKIFLVLFGLGN